MHNITQVELLGGGVRVPKIQSILSDNVGKKLGQHMNGDDSMSFGAAFIAANFSSAFRSKQKLFLTHGTNYDLFVTINPLENTNDNLTLPFCSEQFELNQTNVTSSFAVDCVRNISKSSTIFKKQNHFRINKKVSFKHDGDVSIEIFEKFSNEDPKLLMTYQTKGVREIVSKINNTTEIPRIILNFHLDSKGLIELNVSFIY